VRRRFAPPHTIWVLCPKKNGDSYKTQEENGGASRRHSLLGFCFCPNTINGSYTLLYSVYQSSEVRICFPPKAGKQTFVPRLLEKRHIS
jgi:hypothetical protein